MVYFRKLFFKICDIMLLKRFRIYFTVFFFLFIGIFFSQCSVNENKKIIIGANLPLTGEYALYGQNVKKGMDLAIANSPFKDKVRINYQDNKGSTREAVSVAHNLVRANAITVIDDAISSISLATIPIFERNNITLISTGSTNPALSGVSPYFFRVWNSDAEEGIFAANAAYDILNKKQVVIIYLNTDYGVGLKNAFSEEFSRIGGENIDKISYEENIRDFRIITNQLSRINQYDLIYLIGYPSQTGVITRTIREQRINKTILSTVATQDSRFLELAQDAAEGVKYVFNSTPSGDSYTNFLQKYERKYGEKPQILCDVGYDAMSIILTALKNGIKSGTEMSEYLRTMGEIDGASGVIKFDENGDVHKPMVLMTIRNKEFVKY